MPTVKRIPIMQRTAPRAPKISPKLIDFAKWEHIDEVNSRLDAGDSAYSVHKWVTANGYKISIVWMNEYAKLRKKALVDGVSMNHMLGIVGRPIFDLDELSMRSSKDKLRSEIDALDLIIQGGFNTLKDWTDRPIMPNVLMAAIKLKNDLTDGNHGFLTNFGMEHLRDIEAAKYSLIINHLISYIPRNKQKKAIAKIAEIEEEYYKSTDYYEEYLRTSGEYSEEQIEQKLKKWRESRETTLV